MSEEKIKEELREYFWSRHLDDMKPEELAEKVYSMCVSSEKPRIEYKDGDLEKFFGCDPNFTGGKTTEQHLAEVRGENPQITELERENLGQSDLIEKLQSENAKLATDFLSVQNEFINASREREG